MNEGTHMEEGSHDKSENKDRNMFCLYNQAFYGNDLPRANPDNLKIYPPDPIAGSTINITLGVEMLK